MATPNLNRKGKDLLDALRESLKPKADPVPEGYYQVDRLAKLTGRNEKTVLAELRRIKADKIRLKVLGPNGGKTMGTFYGRPQK